MSAAARPRRTPGLVIREIPDDETVLVTSNGQAVVVNAMASVVVGLADGQRTVAEIAAEIHAAIRGASRAQIEGDVARVVGELTRLGCLET